MYENLPTPKPAMSRNISKEEIIHACGRLLSRGKDVATLTGLKKLGISYS